MKFKNESVNRKDRYAIGIELDSGKYFISIPVENKFIEYSEFYEIDKNEFLEFKKDIYLAIPLAEKCRRHENDNKLILPPPDDRGEAF